MGDKKIPSIPSWQMPSTNIAPVSPHEEVNSLPAGENDASSTEKAGHAEANILKPDDSQKVLSSQTNTPSTTAEDTKLKTIHDSNSHQVSTPSSDALPLLNSTASQSTQSPSVLTSNSPPIITYPEYLFRPQKPPPLVTFDRLLYAIYGVAGLTAAVYGTRKFVVDPMLSSLTDARHSIFSTALTNVQQLNDKLSSRVSHIPPTPPKHADDLEKSETSSLASDPTELFHRDTATQTTPSLPHTPTKSLNPWEDDPSFPSASSATVLSDQADSLTRLRSNLQSLLDDSSDANGAETRASDSLSSLKTYLDGLTYNTYDSYPYEHSSGGKRKPGLAAAAGKNKEDDEIAKFKTEIRSLKGVLLSARNFPAGGSRQAPGYVR